MKVTFAYDHEKDVWCLLNKGKSSNNSQNATKVYEEFVAKYGEVPTSETTSVFIKEYIAENQIDLDQLIARYQDELDSVAEEFQMRAENIFGAKLPQNVTAYLTVNPRAPYSIENNYFYIPTAATSVKKTSMHELWHFYTWYGLGEGEEGRLGKQKYNDLKEVLTVLLNVECKDLLGGAQDNGYPQHKELREKALDFWAKDQNIRNLWEYLVSL
jgi:hypothetical protein